MLTLAALLADLGLPYPLVGAEDVTLSGFSIDSRRVQPADVFAAFKGERVDGHDFVASAFMAGATVALVERGVEGFPLLDTSCPVPSASLRVPLAIRVPNVLTALQRLAQAQRARRPDLRVVAVTGSLGKTTAKEAIAAAMEQRYVTLKSGGNYNNEIGLPLTLLQVEPRHTHAVLEMAMYDLGEIAMLCQIARPQVGVVTNIGPIHLERLGSIERIAQAKAELVAALPSDGLAVLNGDDPLVRAMARATAARVVTFGRGDHNNVWADEYKPKGLEGSSFRVHVHGGDEVGLADAEFPFRVRALGEPAVMAVLSSVAVGLAEGLTPEDIQGGVHAQGYGLRLVPRRGRGGMTILDDRYNASPASTLAALEVLAGLPGRRVAVLGDMLELGPYEAEAHRQVGEGCAQRVDLLVTVGPRAMHVGDSAIAAGLSRTVVQHVPDNAAAIALLPGILSAGDTVLVKGSRGMQMEEIVRALQEPGEC